MSNSKSQEGQLHVVYNSRNRGNSDNLFTNSSTLISALSGSMAKDKNALGCSFEEYKSEDEMHRVLSDTSSEGDESVPAAGRRKRKRNKDVREFDLGSSSSEISEENKVAYNDDEEDGEPFLEPGAICPKHNLKLHSWHKKSR